MLKWLSEHATSRTCYEHVVLNEDDVPSIVGTTMKVVKLVVEQQAYGWSPEELHFQHPYLALERVTELRHAAYPSPVIAPLQAHGLR